MSRETPFDGTESDLAADKGPTSIGDLAVYAAGGGARVAKAGAYVTGGSLVTIYGGATDNGQPESRNTGFESNQPANSNPTPVVTFPDLPSEPQAPYAGDAYNVAAVTPEPLADFPMPMGYSGGFTLPGFTTHEQFHRTSDAPAAGAPPLPPVGGDPGVGLPGAALGEGMADPYGFGHGFPGTGLPHIGLPNLGLPNLLNSLNDLAHLPGPNPAPIDGEAAPIAADGEAGPGPIGAGFADPFEGIGDGASIGIGGGAFVSSAFDVEFGVGPGGAYVSSDLDVSVGAGMGFSVQLGKQLDQMQQYLQNGIDGMQAGTPANGPTPQGQVDAVKTKLATGNTNNSNGAGYRDSANQGDAARAGYSATPSGQPTGVAPIGPTEHAPVLGGPPSSGGSAAPFGQTQGLGVAPAHAAPPVAAFSPAAPATSIAQPVAATPLQTTIQPDAASHPIANVLAAHPGPSLTAPVVLPPLFGGHHQVQPVGDTTPATGGPSTGAGTSPHLPTNPGHLPGDAAKPGLDPITGAVIPLTKPIPSGGAIGSTGPLTGETGTRPPTTDPSTGIGIHPGGTGPNIGGPTTGDLPTHSPRPGSDGTGHTQPPTGTKPSDNGTLPQTGNHGPSAGVPTEGPPKPLPAEGQPKPLPAEGQPKPLPGADHPGAGPSVGTGPSTGTGAGHAPTGAAPEPVAPQAPIPGGAGTAPHLPTNPGHLPGDTGPLHVLPPHIGGIAYTWEPDTNPGASTASLSATGDNGLNSGFAHDTGSVWHDPDVTAHAGPLMHL